MSLLFLKFVNDEEVVKAVLLLIVNGTNITIH